MDAASAGELSAKVVEAHDDEANTLFASVASLWEIQIKTAIGKLELDIPLAQIVDEQLQGDRFQVLDIQARHVVALNELGPVLNYFGRSNQSN